ncbi:DUF4190 domain-containing protein [Mycobacterium sp.]|uniref:DUF4190 domain-containing protein n=1 Tax=Mycobacterium sp. TaxID=1785 RepID=UPI003BAFD835
MTEFPGEATGQSNVPTGPPPGALPFPYPPGAYPPPQYSGFPPPPTGPSNELAVASLVVGILAVATSPLVVGLFLGIAAVVMGVAARRRIKRGETTHGGGLAIGGVMLGIVATFIGLAVGAILALGLAADAFNEDYQHCLGYHNGMSQSCEQYR